MAHPSPLPSFDDEEATIALLAGRALAGRGRRAHVKRAEGVVNDYVLDPLRKMTGSDVGGNALGRGLIGAGIGAAGGGLASMFEPEHKRRPLSSVMSGGLIGGALGAGGSLAYDGLNAAEKPGPAALEESSNKARADVRGKENANNNTGAQPQALHDSAKRLGLTSEQRIRAGDDRFGAGARIDELAHESVRNGLHKSHAEALKHFQDSITADQGASGGNPTDQRFRYHNAWSPSAAWNTFKPTDTSTYGPALRKIDPGIGNLIGLGNSEHVSDDIKRLGSSASVTPALKSRFVGEGDQLLHGMAPTEALAAHVDGQGGRDTMWQKLLRDPKRARIVNGKPVSWTEADRPEYDKLIEEASGLGSGIASLPGQVLGSAAGALPFNANSGQAMVGGLAAADATGVAYRHLKGRQGRWLEDGLPYLEKGQEALHKTLSQQATTPGKLDEIARQAKEPGMISRWLGRKAPDSVDVGHTAPSIEGLKALYAHAEALRAARKDMGMSPVQHNELKERIGEIDADPALGKNVFDAMLKRKGDAAGGPKPLAGEHLGTMTRAPVKADAAVLRGAVAAGRDSPNPERGAPTGMFGANSKRWYGGKWPRILGYGAAALGGQYLGAQGAPADSTGLAQQSDAVQEYLAKQRAAAGGK